MELKTTFYSSMLQNGNFQLLALQLAQNPGDVQAILQALNYRKQVERDHSIKVLQTLLDADVLEGFQLTEVGKRALKELIGAAEQSSPALPSVTDNERAKVQPESEPDWEEDKGELEHNLQNPDLCSSLEFSNIDTYLTHEFQCLYQEQELEKEQEIEERFGQREKTLRLPMLIRISDSTWKSQNIPDCQVI